jgi:hypothetical protein
MANFKLVTYLSLFFLFGCNEQSPHFFSDIALDDKNKFAYHEAHQLSLTLSKLTKRIDESGFSPILHSQFHLEDEQHGPWAQAWVAFNISIKVSGKEVVAIKRAGVLQNHSMDIKVQQELPKFGIKPDQVQIQIQPIAWMPSYPLNIIVSDQIAP